MKLSRFGFNLLVAIWLLPMLLLDVYGNTTTTGVTSDVYYYAAIVHALALFYAGFQCWRKSETSDLKHAKAAVADAENTVVSFEQLGALEYVYCGGLVVVALASWYLHHKTNADNTGFVSLASMVWSMLDIVVAILAGIQFWRIKSGSLTQLVRKMQDA